MRKIIISAQEWYFKQTEMSFLKQKTIKLLLTSMFFFSTTFAALILRGIFEVGRYLLMRWIIMLGHLITVVIYQRNSSLFVWP